MDQRLSVMAIKCISTKFNNIEPLNAHIYFIEVICAFSFCHNAGSKLYTHSHKYS